MIQIRYAGKEKLQYTHKKESNQIRWSRRSIFVLLHFYYLSLHIQNCIVGNDIIYGQKSQLSYFNFQLE